jgi:hypothetical protein
MATPQPPREGPPPPPLPGDVEESGFVVVSKARCGVPGGAGGGGASAQQAPAAAQRAPAPAGAGPFPPSFRMSTCNRTAAGRSGPVPAPLSHCTHSNRAHWHCRRSTYPSPRRPTRARAGAVRRAHPRRQRARRGRRSCPRCGPRLDRRGRGRCGRRDARRALWRRVRRGGAAGVWGAGRPPPAARPRLPRRSLISLSLRPLNHQPRRRHPCGGGEPSGRRRGGRGGAGLARPAAPRARAGLAAVGGMRAGCGDGGQGAVRARGFLQGLFSQCWSVHNCSVKSSDPSIKSPSNSRRRRRCRRSSNAINGKRGNYIRGREEGEGCPCPAATVRVSLGSWVQKSVVLGVPSACRPHKNAAAARARCSRSEGIERVSP